MVRAATLRFLLFVQKNVMTITYQYQMLLKHCCQISVVRYSDVGARQRGPNLFPSRCGPAHWQFMACSSHAWRAIHSLGSQHGEGDTGLHLIGCSIIPPPAFFSFRAFLLLTWPLPLFFGSGASQNRNQRIGTRIAPQEEEHVGNALHEIDCIHITALLPRREEACSPPGRRATASVPLRVVPRARARRAFQELAPLERVS